VFPCVVSIGDHDFESLKHIFIIPVEVAGHQVVELVLTKHSFHIAEEALHDVVVALIVLQVVPQLIEEGVLRLRQGLQALLEPAEGVEVTEVGGTHIVASHRLIVISHSSSNTLLRLTHLGGGTVFGLDLSYFTDCWRRSNDLLGLNLLNLLMW
jgi:hypothetical protein